MGKSILSAPLMCRAQDLAGVARSLRLETQVGEVPFFRFGIENRRAFAAGA